MLDTYIASKGDKYKSHAAVFKADSWVWERVDKGNGVRPTKLGNERANYRTLEHLGVNVTPA